MAAISTRRLAINPYGDQYPDDDSTKEAVVEADGLVTATTGDRHVLLRWINGTDAGGRRYAQILHLTGGPGNYSFHTPQSQDTFRGVSDGKHMLRARTVHPRAA